MRAPTSAEQAAALQIVRYAAPLIAAVMGFLRSSEIERHISNRDIEAARQRWAREPVLRHAGPESFPGAKPVSELATVLGLAIVEALDSSPIDVTDFVMGELTTALTEYAERRGWHAEPPGEIPDDVVKAW